MDPGVWIFCLVMGLAFGGLIAVAVVTKVAEARRMSAWPAVTGTVTASTVRAHKKRFEEEESHYENEPYVAYTYKVGNRSYRASRISLAEKIGGAEIAGILERYPVGRTVQVYYNPADPEKAVLERDLPPAVGKGALILILFFVGAGVGLPLLLAVVSGWLAPLLPYPQRAVPATLLAGMGLFSLLLAYAIQKQVRAAQTWQATTGKILVADVEAYRDWVSTEGRSRLRTLYRPSIVYSFDVDGRQFISDRVSFGGQFGASLLGRAPGFMRAGLARYPVGSAVQVYFNPQNPTESVLERRAAGLFLLPVVTALMWALALLFARTAG